MFFTTSSAIQKFLSTRKLTILIDELSFRGLAPFLATKILDVILLWR
jgi:ABC-type branched-subunit amino acid transport system ATPase component